MAFSNIMVTTRARHCANMVVKEKVHDSLNKSPVVKKKVVIKHRQIQTQHFLFPHTCWLSRRKIWRS